MRLLPVIAASLGIALIPQSALAVNVHFLRDSVLSQFSPEEAQDFRTAVGGALDNLEDQQVFLWKSSSSDLKGKFKSKFTYTTNGVTCRRSLFLIGHDDKKENFRFDICKTSEGWKIQDTPARQFKESDWEKFKVSATHTLNHPQEGQPISWYNPETKHSGVNVVTAIYRLNGKNCRDMAITLFDSTGNSSAGNYAFCKPKQGDWQRYIKQN